MWRIAGSVLLTAFAAVSGIAASEDAITVVPPPALLPNPPLLITAYSVDTATPNYIELYNDSDTMIRASDWSLVITWALDANAPVGSPLTPPLSLPISTNDTLYMLPKQYIVLSFGTSVTGAAVTIDPLTGETGNFISNLSLDNSDYKPYVKLFSSPQTQRMRLNQTTTGYTSTGSYSVDDRNALYDNGFYQPRDSFPLAPYEILANPRRCSPLEASEDCKEYVEFYNDTRSPISFDGTSLRIGDSTSADSIVLSGTMMPGEYSVFDMDAAGKPLTISNSGGFIWLEDTYGVRMYDNTVVSYANVTASHKGQSWSLVNGNWQWSLATPAAQNKALPVDPPKRSRATTNLTPCQTNQYRNPLTNRCKLIATTSSSSSLTPCAAGQYRNPTTNRCKSAVLGATTTLKPCAVNQTRNLETNRCRKTVSSVPDAAFAIEPVKDSAKAFIGWWALGGVGLLAAGYGVWEWRQELRGLLQKTVGFFSSGH